MESRRVDYKVVKQERFKEFLFELSQECQRQFTSMEVVHRDGFQKRINSLLKKSFNGRYAYFGIEESVHKFVNTGLRTMNRMRDASLINDLNAYNSSGYR